MCNLNSALFYFYVASALCEGRRPIRPAGRTGNKDRLVLLLCFLAACMGSRQSVLHVYCQGEFSLTRGLCP